MRRFLQTTVTRLTDPFLSAPVHPPYTTHHNPEIPNPDPNGNPGYVHMNPAMPPMGMPMGYPGVPQQGLNPVMQQTLTQNLQQNLQAMPPIPVAQMQPRPPFAMYQPHANQLQQQIHQQQMQQAQLHQQQQQLQQQQLMQQQQLLQLQQHDGRRPSQDIVFSLLNKKRNSLALTGEDRQTLQHQLKLLGQRPTPEQRRQSISIVKGFLGDSSPADENNLNLILDDPFLTNLLSVELGDDKT